MRKKENNTPHTHFLSKGEENKILCFEKLQDMANINIKLFKDYIIIIIPVKLPCKYLCWWKTRRIGIHFELLTSVSKQSSHIFFSYSNIEKYMWMISPYYINCRIKTTMSLAKHSKNYFFKIMKITLFLLFTKWFHIIKNISSSVKISTSRAWLFFHVVFFFFLFVKVKYPVWNNDPTILPRYVNLLIFFFFFWFLFFFFQEFSYRYPIFL